MSDTVFCIRHDDDVLFCTRLGDDLVTMSMMTMSGVIQDTGIKKSWQIYYDKELPGQVSYVYYDCTH